MSLQQYEAVQHNTSWLMRKRDDKPIDNNGYDDG